MQELSERRLVENELMFRHYNNKTKRREQREHTADDSELFVDFYCECSNRTCHERIAMSIEDYEKAHQNNKLFIALPHHENTSVEQVVREEAGYNIIQKYTDPAEVING